jgi:hypothetical protein
VRSLYYLIITFCLVFLPTASFSANIFSSMKETVTGQGIGEITDLGGGKYDIAVAGGLSQNRAEALRKWERTADSACNGSTRQVLTREFSSGSPLMVTGVVQCGAQNAGTATPDVAQASSVSGASGKTPVSTPTATVRSSPPPSDQSNEKDITTKLKELNQLKKDGAITEKEFALLKEKALKAHLQ